MKLKVIMFNLDECLRIEELKLDNVTLQTIKSINNTYERKGGRILPQQETIGDHNHDS